MDLLYPLLPIGIGLAAMAWLLRDIVGARLLRSRGEHTEARVVGYQETSGTSRMIVRFHTESGEEVLTTHDNTSWAAARYGDLVTVCYNPDHPEKARVVAAPWLSAWPRGMFMGLASGLVIIGAALGFFAWT
ncbi:DUF3592 domain-containing protein [Nocardiopsis ansamitocini]|uniref:DUF3592 domain-containing protein n=1 Tax=Nocardiopsis ansamitocini TaxID=1670832 RepID=A0A9W6PAZ0_9ACTN|nr:DUF3592 domain-containing protein [Nocardiopsis ansamitocini]GLU50355.1 hypothetical protein Nans01_47060 [Nocardiopsis ansamitocini]